MVQRSSVSSAVILSLRFRMAILASALHLAWTSFENTSLPACFKPQTLAAKVSSGCWLPRASPSSQLHHPHSHRPSLQRTLQVPFPLLPRLMTQLRCPRLNRRSCRLYLLPSTQQPCRRQLTSHLMHRPTLRPSFQPCVQLRHPLKIPPMLQLCSQLPTQRMTPLSIRRLNRLVRPRLRNPLLCPLTSPPRFRRILLHTIRPKC